MLIINGIVHTMDGQTIPRGFVAVSGGKIARVGAMEDCPDHWEGETVDAGGDHVLPGFIDAHSHLGMFGDAVGFEGDDGNEATDPCTPHLRAIDAIYPQDRCFQEAREGGVTTVLTGPGSANPVSGQFAAIKTAGRWVDEMVVKAPAAMKMALGENPKCVYNERHETPVTRMATAAIIRENLSKALEYGEKLDRAEEDEDEERPIHDTAPTPEEHLDNSELGRELAAALDEVSEEHRRIVLLRDVSGMSYTEIAEILEISEGTVKSRLARARIALRKVLLQRGNILPPASSNQVKGGGTHE